jgi:hypothetical protein
MKPNVLGMKLKNKINIKKIGTKKITIKRIRIKFDTKNK